MFWFASLGALLLLNVAATVGAVRSGLYESRQLAWQLLLVWLLPLLGAAIVILVAISQGKQTSTRSNIDHSEWENVNAGPSHEAET